MEPNQNNHPDTESPLPKKSSKMQLMLWPLTGMIITIAVLASMHILKQKREDMTETPTADAVVPTVQGPSGIFTTHNQSIVRVINPTTGKSATGLFIKTSKKDSSLLTTRDVSEQSGIMIAVKEATGENPRPQAWVITQIIRGENVTLLNVEDNAPKGIALQNASGSKPGDPIITLGYGSKGGSHITLLQGTISSLEPQYIQISGVELSQGTPIFNSDGNAIAIAMDGVMALRSVALIKTELVRAEETAPEEELESARRIANAWETLNPQFTALLKTHTEKYSPQGKALVAGENELKEALSKLAVAEKAVPWGTINQPGDAVTKIRTLVGFVEAARGASGSAAKCITIQDVDVDDKILHAASMSQNAETLASTAMRLVARMENNTADQELKDELSRAAQAYFQSKKIQEDHWR